MFKSIVLVLKDNHYIISKEFQDTTIILPQSEIIDNNSLRYQTSEGVYETIYFDYLIFDDMNILSNLNIEKEHKRAITNYELQTSIDNIFAIGEANNSTRDKQEELNSVFEFLKDQN